MKSKSELKNFLYIYNDNNIKNLKVLYIYSLLIFRKEKIK